MIRTYRIFIERELGDALSCAAYLKAQMENDYLGEIKQHCNCEWSLVYSTRELTVTVDDTGYDDETLDQLFAENGYERLA